MRHEQDARHSNDLGSSRAGSIPAVDRTADAPADEYDPELQRAVEYIIDECFFAVGQAMPHKTLDHETLVFWRDRYRAKFLRTMQVFGNRWMEDRERVKAVGRLLGERAAYYAGDSPTIGRASADKASADVERYCAVHSARRLRQAGGTVDADQPVIHAGYWCQPYPSPVM